MNKPVIVDVRRIALVTGIILSLWMLALLSTCMAERFGDCALPLDSSYFHARQNCVACRKKLRQRGQRDSIPHKQLNILPLICRIIMKGSEFHFETLVRKYIYNFKGGIRAMTKVFLISDHHFGHKNIIDFESRPFTDVDEMTLIMIERWNAVVGKDDKVFHLGDFSFLNREKTSDIVSQLNGNKFLIMGNHDRGRTRSWWLDVGFNEVSENPIVYSGFYFLSHEPMYMNKHMPYVNIHGHIHGQKYEGKQYINVSVEHWNYEPVSFDMIKEMVVPNEEQ